MEYLKLTLDIQGCCGRAAACSGAHRAAVLALVPRPGIRDGQQGPPRADFNVIYKQTTVRVLKKTLRCWCHSFPAHAPLTLQRLVVGSFPLHWFHCTAADLAPEADRLPLAHGGGPRLHGDARLARNCAHRDTGSYVGQLWATTFQPLNFHSPHLESRTITTIQINNCIHFCF